MRRARLLAPPVLAPLAVALAVGLSGCSGGGTSTAAGGPAASTAPATSAGPAAGDPAKLEYVRRAEAICSRANTELAAVKVPTDPAQVDAYIDKGLALAQGVSDDLSALQAPAADATALKEELTDPLAAKVAALKAFAAQYRQATKAGGASAAATVTPPTLPRPDSAFLTGYGFSACTQLAQAGT